jgi:tetratricopeptide (TPR) repeat protein
VEVEQATASAARHFSSDLAELHAKAGKPSYSMLERLSGRQLRRATMSDILNGNRMRVPDWRFVAAFVEACRTAAQEGGLDASALGSLADWKRHWDGMFQVPGPASFFQDARDDLTVAAKAPEDPPMWLPDVVHLRKLSDSHPPTATRTLPRDIATFTGRTYELARLVEAVSEAQGSGGMARIQAIGGMAGVGKTALAVHAAHMLAETFPDGQIFLGLHGHTPGLQPVDPEGALSTLLRTTGLAPEQIPIGLEERAALWRDRSANRRVLVVLDDAVSSGQVQPLLPSSPGSVTLITSRRHLIALEDAQTISLDTLPPNDAATLLVRLADRPGLRSNDQAVQQITRLCGYLPLAIGILGSQLRHHPTWSAARLVEAVSSARDRLELLTAEDSTVTAALNMSYEQLTEAQRRLFRHIGLHPGTDIDIYTAAALDNAEASITRRHLDSLYDQHLLSEPAPGRYRLHDLVREYARSLAALDPADENESAIRRLLGYYQDTAASADRHLSRRSRPSFWSESASGTSTAMPAFDNEEQALSWTRTERVNLLACLDMAAQAGLHLSVVRLTAGAASLLQRDGPWDVAIHRHTFAAQTAQQLGDHFGEANALNDLGIVRRLVGDYRGASEALESALVIYRDLGDRLGEANALNSVGTVAYLIGDYAKAARALESALVTYRDLGDRLGDARTLTYLGFVQHKIGDNPGAAVALETALSIYRELSYGLGEAAALVGLTAVQQQTGDYPGAANSLEAAMSIYQQLGYRLGEATAFTGMGRVRQKTGDYSGAAVALETALSIYRELGDRGGEAEVLNEIGTVHRSFGNIARAEACHSQALDLSREIASSWDEAYALVGLGNCALTTGRTEEAQKELRDARAILQRLSAAEDASLDSEIRALDNIHPPA